MLTGLDLITDNYLSAKFTSNNTKLQFVNNFDEEANDAEVNQEVEDIGNQFVEDSPFIDPDSSYGYIFPPGMMDGGGIEDNFLDNDIPTGVISNESRSVSVDSMLVTSVSSIMPSHSHIEAPTNTSVVIHSPEILLSVEEGTKGVYFDLSYFWEQLNSNCRNHSNENQTFEFDDPKYSSAKYIEDKSGRIVHSATILSKHNLLFVLFFSNQEGRPEPLSTFPHNITLSMYGTRKNVTSEVTSTLIVKFILQIVPKIDKSSISLYSPSNLISDHYTGTCEAYSKKPTKYPKLNIISSDILSLPYLDTRNNSAGIVFKLLMPNNNMSVSETILANTSISEFFISLKVTAKNGSAYNYLSNLKFSTVHFKSGSVGFVVNNRSVEDSMRFEDYLNIISPISGIIPYLEYSNALRGLSFTRRDKEEQQKYYKNYIVLLIHLPLPSDLLNGNKDWIHSKLEMYLAPPNYYDSDNFNRWSIAPTFGTHSNFSAVNESADNDQKNHRNRIGCVTSVFKWGREVVQKETVPEFPAPDIVNTNQTDVDDLNQTFVDTNQTEIGGLNPLDSTNISDFYVINDLNTSYINSTFNNATKLRRRLKMRSLIMKSSFSIFEYWNRLIDDVVKYFVNYDLRSETNRKLSVDTYAMSLIHVNRLYNSEFGSENRKVPAHVPHMIDKDVMNEMQSKWSNEWTATASHRFRSAKDMQYSFSYYYYATNRHKLFNHDYEAFLSYTVDTDFDRYINPNEFRTLASLVKGKAPLEEDIQNLRDCIEDNSNLKTHREDTFFQVTIGRIKKSFSVQRYPTIKDALACPNVIEGLKANIGWDSIYGSNPKMESDSGVVAFEMIGDNYTTTLAQLDSVRARQWKFVCINDNMENPSIKLEKALQDFYESFFPYPSIFELPKGKSNPTLYLDEYKRIKNSISVVSLLRSLLTPFLSIGWVILWLGNLLMSLVINALRGMLYILQPPAAIEIDKFEYYVNDMRKEFHQPPITATDGSASIQSSLVFAISVVVLIIIVAIRTDIKEAKKRNLRLNQIIPIPIDTEQSQSQQIADNDAENNSNNNDNSSISTGPAVITSPEPNNFSMRLGIFRAPKTPSKKEILKQKQLEDDDGDDVSGIIAEVPKMTKFDDTGVDSDDAVDYEQWHFPSGRESSGLIRDNEDLHVEDVGLPISTTIQSIPQVTNEYNLRGGLKKSNIKY